MPLAEQVMLNRSHQLTRAVSAAALADEIKSGGHTMTFNDCSTIFSGQLSIAGTNLRFGRAGGMNNYALLRQDGKGNDQVNFGIWRDLAQLIDVFSTVAAVQDTATVDTMATVLATLRAGGTDAVARAEVICPIPQLML